MSFFEELKRRNVIRVGVAYAVAAWFLLQISDLVLENIGAPAWVIQAIMLLLGIGFPLVIIFAWAFEMTPEGIKKEKDVDRSQSIAAMTGRKLDRMIIGILTVVIAYLLIDKLVLQDPAPAPVETAQTATAEPAAPAESGPSVAVLPFVNMSGDADNEYFSDGLTETLLHMLAQLPDLRVAARTSSFAFKGKDTGIEEISKILGVAHVLEGSVQKAGNRVRITAQLIRGDDAFHVWSQNYDRTLDDIFAIQDEIARDVASALDASLMGNAGVAMHGVSTRSTKAYDLYLKAMEQQAIFSYGSLASAESLFKNALAVDPGFTDAKLALARNYQMKFGTGLIDEHTASQAVDPLLKQVEDEHPGDPMARALALNFRLRSFSTMVDAESREATINELKSLLPRIPSDTWIRESVANSLRLFDAFDEALDIINAGLLLDPLSADMYSSQAEVYMEMKRFEEARSAINRAIELAPDNPNLYSDMADLDQKTGQLVSSLNWTRKAIETDPQDHELVAQLAEKLFLLGLAEEGARWASRCYALAPQTVVCRKLQLIEARARNDNARRLELATAMLRDDVEMRRFGFTSALFSYVDLMTDQGRAKEGYDFLASLYPGIAEIDKAPVDLKHMLVRQAGVELMKVFAPREQFLSTLDSLISYQQAAKLPWLDSPRSQVYRHLLRDEFDQAKTIALNDELTWNPADSLNVDYRYQTPLYRGLAQQPEVAARLRERSTEIAVLRDEVQTMLLEPEWNQ